MTQLVKCDACGTISEGDAEYFNVNRWSETSGLTGDICPDCMPESIVNCLNEEEY